MLSEKEEACIAEFFEDFPSTDLFAVALLISKRNLQPDSRKDALKIICQHTDCLETVLAKKRISKKYLSQYLHKNKVSVTFAWEKPALVRKVLEYWTDQKKLSSRQDSTNSLQLNYSLIYYEQLTTKFSEWFYSLMNDPNLTSLGPEHFFIDAQMKIALQNSNTSEIIEASTSIDVAQALHALQTKYRFRFLPNLSPNAVKYQTDIHGQIMLMVSGTLQLFNISQVVGLFEQMFLLLRDASDNENWKIKNSHIILKSASNAVEHHSPTNMLSLPAVDGESSVICNNN